MLGAYLYDLYAFRVTVLILVDSDLGLLKRDKKLQERYNTWSAEIRQEYGSMGKSCFSCLPKA